MQVTLGLLFFATVLTVVKASSDAGYFVPKAFYILNANGGKTDLHPISPHIAHYLTRVRRQTVSSSSSSVVSDGGPVYFSSQQAVHQPPGFVASRFGGDQASGHVVQTTGVIDQDGRVLYRTVEGHL